MWCQSRLLNSLAMILTIVLAPGAFGQAGDLQIHGFMTAGAAGSDSELPYYDGIDQRFDFSRDSKLGINLSKRLDDTWAMAAQIKAIGRQASTDVTLDWAFATWYPTNSLAMRFGQQKMPTWLISDYSEVGRSYPWVRPPAEVYSLNPLTSFSGISTAYTFRFSGWELETMIAGGGFDTTITDASPKPVANVRNFVGTFFTLSNENLTVRVARAIADAGIQTSFYNINKMRAEFREVGARLDWKGLLVYSEWARSIGTTDPDERDRAVEASAIAAGKAASSRSPSDQAAARAAAIQAMFLTNSLLGGEGWYVTTGYQFGDFLPHFTYANLDSPEDSVGAGDQESFALGLKYDVSLSTDLKFEVQKARPLNQTSGLFDRRSFEDFDRVFPDLTLYSMALDFVF